MKPFSSLTLASSLLAALTFSAHAEEAATVEKCPKNFGAVGGSYGTGDLADVALNWIVDQARTSGVTMFAWGNGEWTTTPSTANSPSLSGSFTAAR